MNEYHDIKSIIAPVVRMADLMNDMQSPHKSVRKRANKVLPLAESQLIEVVNQDGVHYWLGEDDCMHDYYGMLKHYMRNREFKYAQALSMSQIDEIIECFEPLRTYDI